MATRRKKPKMTEKILPIEESKYRLNLKHFNITDRQKDFLKKALDEKTKIMFIAGPSGCSKTFMSVYSALRLFNENNEYDIFYVRTIVESADRGLGHLPGDVEEKFHPFMMPLTDKMQELLNPDQIKMLTEEKIISAAPVNYLRGANWSNKLIIADESQNFTLKELVTLVTRIGQNTKMFVCGDPLQSDINGKTGFRTMWNAFNDSESDEQGIYCFEFTKDDIVRSEILKFIVNKIENIPKINKNI
jgi:phosphate starvation-inducible PhoH-like protein